MKKKYVKYDRLVETEFIPGDVEAKVKNRTTFDARLSLSVAWICR